MNLHKSFKYGLSVLLPLILIGCSKPTDLPQAQAPALHVDTLTLTASNIRLTNQLPARVSAIKEAQVRPQITGILESRLFNEGDQVKKGDVLYQIDDTTYQATVNSAKAQLEKSLAAQSTTKKVEERYRDLLTKELISQQTYDDAHSAYLQAKADVAISKAALDAAEIELSYTKIKAPISGTVGMSEVSEGSLLTSGQSSYLTTIIQSDHVYIDMQQSSVSLYKLKKAFSDKTDERPSIPVSVTLEDGTQYSEQGYLEFSDAQVNASTGSVTLRAIMPNTNRLLLPGMFVQATIAMPEAKEYLVLPQSSIVRTQSGSPTVYVVNENGITERKEIVLGNEVNNGWIVEGGLQAGEKVIISNLLKVKSEQSVVIDSDSDTNADQITSLNSQS